MIDKTVYSIGGLTKNGQISDFVSLDLIDKCHKEPKVKRGAQLLQPVDMSAITPVFYSARMSSRENLKIENLTASLNWGEAFELIQHEGFYMFGGRLQSGESSNRLLVFEVSKDVKDLPVFSIIRPRTLGIPPPPRYSHGIDYIPDLSSLVIHGGRNDMSKTGALYYDIWLLKLNNLEYQKVLVAGEVE